MPNHNEDNEKIKFEPAGINDKPTITAISFENIPEKEIEEENKKMTNTNDIKIDVPVSTELEQGATIKAYPGGKVKNKKGKSREEI